MSSGQLQIVSSKVLADRLRSGELADAIHEIARMVGAELTIVSDAMEDETDANSSLSSGNSPTCVESPHVPAKTQQWQRGSSGAEAHAVGESPRGQGTPFAKDREWGPLKSPARYGAVPILYRQKCFGRIRFAPCAACESPDAGQCHTDGVARAARAIAKTLQHALDREMAVEDLAEEMLSCYEELNMLYTLLPSIATRVHTADVGEALADETMRTLHCGRVSLLVLDDARRNLKVLAARGLPDEVQDQIIPIAPTGNRYPFEKDDGLVGNNWSHRPDLMELARGECHDDAVEVIRVPLQARGEAVGILTVAERYGHTEFTARDRKLLEGLSAMGASALLNCRLHQAINHQMISTIRALASAIDAKDRYTHAHSARVAQLCIATARELGTADPETLREVELAGLLHDIGKIGIPDAILSKPCGLTPQEFVMVQRHVEVGAHIVEHVNGLERVAQAVRHHHERYDGLGYPSGLSGESIPFLARLIAVPDVYDVLTSDRPYRTRIPPKNAVQELVKSKASQLDPVIVDAFQRVIERETAGDGHSVPTADTPSDAKRMRIPAPTPL